MQTCQACGHQNSDDVTRCIACGSGLRAAAAAPAAERPPMASGLPATLEPIQGPVLSGYAPSLRPEEVEAAAGPPPDASLDDLIAYALRMQASGHPREALGAYERAFQIDAQSRVVLDGMLQIARHLGDPVRESRCLATLSQLAASPAEQADYLIQASLVTRDKRGEPEKASFGLLRALELDPDRLDAFITLTEIYSETAQWQEMEGAYQRMIQLHAQRSRQNPKLLAKLWRKMGLLIAQHFGRFADAEVALEQASRIDPDDVKNHATRYELFRQQPERWRDAAAALHQMIACEPDHDEQARLIRLLGELYAAHDELDAAFCVLRTLDFLGEADEEERALVGQGRRQMPKIPERALTNEQWHRHIYPTDFPFELARIYALIATAVHPLLENDHEYHGVRPGDRLDLSKPLLFNNLVRKLSVAFGLDHAPEIFVREGVGGLGMIDGLFDPTGFVVDRSLFSGRRPQEVAFVVARRLAFLRHDLYMVGVGTPDQLRGYLMAAIKFARPDSAIQATGDLNRVVRALKGRLSSEQAAFLSERLGGMIDAGVEVALDHYIQRADAVANRMALLACDELEAAAGALAIEGRVEGLLSPDERLDELLRFSVSNAYLELRQLLGVAL